MNRIRIVAARVLRAVPDRFWLIYLVIGSVLCGLYVFVVPLKGSGPLINALGLSAVIAVVVGIRRHRPAASSAWWCFAAGLFLFWLGDIYTYSYPRLFHASVPFPSVGDGVYLLVYPVLMAGLVVLVRRRNKRGNGPGLIDALIMTLGLSLVSGILLIAPYIHDHSLSLFPKLVSIGYPMGDIIILAAAIRLAVDGGKRRPAFYLLIGSIVTLLATDFIYGLLTLGNAYTHQLGLDVGWIFFYLLWGAAALHPSMRELSEASGEEQPRLTPFRLTLLAVATMAAPALEFAKALPRHDFDLLVIIGASVVLFALVVGRMAGLVRQRESSVARESALTLAGGRLVAATSREEIILAALNAVDDVGHGKLPARVCSIGDADITVAAVQPDGALSEWTIARRFGSAMLTAGETVEIDVSGTLRSQLRVPPGFNTARLVQLPTSGGRDWVLVVAGQTLSTDDTRYALRTLASQVVLALESAALGEEVHRRASEARFSSLVQNSSDLITVLDADSTIVYQSPAIEGVLGYTADEVTGLSFEQLLHTSEQGRMLRRLDHRSSESAGPSDLIECSLRHKDGSPRQFEILPTNLLDNPAVKGIVLNGRDVSERKAFEEQLAHQAFHDPVTHLANRALFNERVRHAVARSQREQFGLAVIFIDLDDFKTVNDSLGHAAGDSVLLEVAHRISDTVRHGDTAARFGGDEFAVLLEDVRDLQAAVETAERILDSFSRPVDIEQDSLVIRASLGISIAEAGSLAGADELIRNADAAMYIAKADGKGAYRIFEPAMHERVLARLQLRADLEGALARAEFELHYQPVIRLRDGSVSGLEALVRWRHPTRGMLAPDEFIPFAEESGLIIPIGLWVLQEGCRQAKRFRSLFGSDAPPTIAINLSVKQLFHATIVADVTAALADAALEPSALTLEITESVMMTDTDLAVARLTELRALGIKLAMDDFGTGYSSLSYLSRFPLDILKMDRSLLAGGTSPVTSGLATAVLSLGETFQLEVVAEGIEHVDQSSTLRALGCELGQGFYFARPMTSEELFAYLHGGVSAAGRI